MSDDKKDNVEYLPGKPGFYKKAPGEFKISFGNLEDLVEGAEKTAADEAEAKRLKSVPPEEPEDNSTT